jgi:hypothetical protein
VPLRSDRRDLRRQLRATLRATRAEHKRRVTAGLATLASHRVPIASVRQDVLGDDLIEFTDGTCIWIEVREGIVALRRLAPQSGRRDLYLRRVELNPPGFVGGCGYWIPTDDRSVSRAA